MIVRVASYRWESGIKILHSVPEQSLRQFWSFQAILTHFYETIAVSLGIESYGVHDGDTFHDEKMWPAVQCVENPVLCVLHLPHIIANVTCHQRPQQAQGAPSTLTPHLRWCCDIHMLCKPSNTTPPNHNQSLKVVTQQFCLLSCPCLLWIFLELLWECPLMLLMIVGTYCNLYCCLYQQTFSCSNTLDGCKM